MSIRFIERNDDIIKAEINENFQSWHEYFELDYNNSFFYRNEKYFLKGNFLEHNGENTIRTDVKSEDIEHYRYEALEVLDKSQEWFNEENYNLLKKEIQEGDVESSLREGMLPKQELQMLLTTYTPEQLGKKEKL